MSDKDQVKTILFVNGKDLPNYGENFFNVVSQYPDLKCITVGDGSRNVDLSDIKAGLDQINGPFLFILFCHGKRPRTKEAENQKMKLFEEEQKKFLKEIENITDPEIVAEKWKTRIAQVTLAEQMDSFRLDEIDLIDDVVLNLNTTGISMREVFYLTRELHPNTQTNYFFVNCFSGYGHQIVKEILKPNDQFCALGGSTQLVPVAEVNRYLQTIDKDIASYQGNFTAENVLLDYFLTDYESSLFSATPQLTNDQGTFYPKLGVKDDVDPSYKYANTQYSIFSMSADQKEMAIKKLKNFVSEEKLRQYLDAGRYDAAMWKIHAAINYVLKSSGEAIGKPAEEKVVVWKEDLSEEPSPRPLMVQDDVNIFNLNENYEFFSDRECMINFMDTMMYECYYKQNEWFSESLINQASVTDLVDQVTINGVPHTSGKLYSYKKPMNAQDDIDLTEIPSQQETFFVQSQKDVATNLLRYKAGDVPDLINLRVEHAYPHKNFRIKADFKFFVCTKEQLQKHTVAEWRGILGVK